MAEDPQVKMMRKMMGDKTVNKAILGFIEAASPKGDDLPEDQKIGKLVSAKVGAYAIAQKMSFNEYLDALMCGRLDDGITLSDVEAMGDKEVYDMMMSHFGEEKPIA